MAIGLLVYLSVLPIDLSALRFTRAEVTGVDVETVYLALRDFLVKEKFPKTIDIGGPLQGTAIAARYTVRPELQAYLDEIYERWGPDYAGFFAMDADTGAVLAYSDYVRHPEDDIYGNLALNALYPAASVFKVVTAAAALDQDLVQTDTVVPYNGRSTTLYKKQVLQEVSNKWTRRPTVKKAFGNSVNTVFAKLGVFTLGADDLKEYARRFAFNRYDLLTDLPIDLGHSHIEDRQWVLAEVASGYTRRNTLSPVHGAMLASAVATDGRIAIPHVVARLSTQYGWPVYIGKPRHLPPSIHPETVKEMRSLMRQTVRYGTASRYFDDFDLDGVKVGGKTGSLSGAHPKGRTEWFIGYACKGDDRIAFASVTVSEKKWRIKPERVARLFIKKYFEGSDS